ncbi:hypothetical protein ACR03S_08280 [Limimaricola variabilis]
MTPATIYGFAPAFGLPTSGPFTLKLLAWCRLNGVPFEFKVENNPGKGPLKKSPWAEIDGETVADSDAIIARLTARHDVPPPAIDTAPAAAGRAWKMAAEEGLHQIYEHELIMLPEGSAWFRDFLRADMPAPIAALAHAAFRRSLGRQFHARGMTRLGPEGIAARGRDLLDALDLWLGVHDFIEGPAPGIADATLYGMLAPMRRWSMQTPVARHARGLPAIAAWDEELTRRCGFAAD